jgi:DnaJ like chaperone protein
MGNADAKSGLGAVMRDLKGAIGELFTGGKLEEEYHMPVDVAFGMIGWLAKADSIITSHEAEFVNGLMDELNLPTQGRAIASAAFDRGRLRKIDIKQEAQRFLAVYPKGSPELFRLYDTLLRLAAVDGRVFAREKVALEQITDALGFSRETLAGRLEAISGKDD